MTVEEIKKQLEELIKDRESFMVGDYDTKGYACPSCDMGVEIHLFKGGYVKERFCSCCGQALDWSVT